MLRHGQPFHRRLIFPTIAPSNPKRPSLGPLYPSVSIRLFRSSTSLNNNFFEYSSGRWIHDEGLQMSRRYRRFNVEALKKVSAQACGAQTVVGMEKIAEGSYNKIFNIKADNGKEVIARIPTPLAGPDHLVTASEVATMDYVRSCLGVPTPRVLAWCSDASSTPVKSEYIIMEKAQGIELGRVWDKMTPELRDRVVQEWVSIEKLQLQPVFGGYGSIFYREDLKSQDSLELYTAGDRDERFVIGPSVQPAFWKDERRMMNIDRGPWRDVLSAVRAISDRERQWIDRYAVANSRPGPFDPPVNIQQASAHLSLLDRFNKVAPYIIPAHTAFSRPTLWHTDLHFGNLFLSEDALANGKIVITSVIDWQHVSIAPLFLQVRVPLFARYHGPTLLPIGPATICLPDDFESMDSDDQQSISWDVELANHHKFYEATAASQNTEYYILSNSTRQTVVPIIEFLGRTWSGGFVPLRDTLIRIIPHWDSLGPTDVPCPIEFSASERFAHVAESKEWQEAEDGLVILRSQLGVREDGWVENEYYDDAIARNEDFKSDFMKTLPEGPDKDEFMAVWPYRPQG